MKFSPPVIRYIDDVLPHIEGNDGIKVFNKGWYTVIDYVYNSGSTFSNEFARECRGLKFDTLTGQLLARPYHKFHNLGENPEYATDNVDLTKAHYILDKLDGSMVHTCIGPSGDVSLMTRMGQTDVALRARVFMEEKMPQIADVAKANKGVTFIYEYVGPDNKIVIHYPEEKLILTAMRINFSGKYFQYGDMAFIAHSYHIPVVGKYDFVSYEMLAEDDVNEGVVIRFDTGAMVKIKSDIYVRKHRSKDLASSFKGLVDLILKDELDDVIPQLDPEWAKEVIQYQFKLQVAINQLCTSLIPLLEKTEKWQQKTFALYIQKHEKKELWPVLFKARAGCGIGSPMKLRLLSAVRTTTELTDLFTTLGLPIWSGSFFQSE